MFAEGIKDKSLSIQSLYEEKSMRSGNESGKR